MAAGAARGRGPRSRWHCRGRSLSLAGMAGPGARL